MGRRRWSRTAAVLVLLTGCARPPVSEEEMQDRIDRETASARQAIEATNQRFTMHFNAGNGDSVAVIFAERGRAMWPNAPAAVGHAAIAGGYNARRSLKPSLSLRTEEVAANGPIAVERGRYTMSWTTPAGAQVADSGKYLVRWHRMVGEWVMVDNIWNSDLPASRSPAPAPSGPGATPP